MKRMQLGHWGAYTSVCFGWLMISPEEKLFGASTAAVSVRGPPRQKICSIQHMSDAPSGSEQTASWRNLAVIAVLAIALWWVWRRYARKAPAVRLVPNTPAPLAVQPGVPPTLVTRLAQSTDTQIPVVMTSGSQVPYDDADIKQIVQRALDRLNSLGEKVSLIQVVSASKTQDSYKTVAYDIVISAYDGKENVGVKLSLSALVPVTGKVYIRAFKLFNTPSEKDAGPPGPGADPTAEFARYEDPVSVLRNMKL